MAVETLVSSVEELIENVLLSSSHRDEEKNKAFSNLVLEYAKATLLRLPLNDNLRAQFALDTLSEVWASSDELKKDPNFKVWVCQKARRLAIQELRKRSDYVKQLDGKFSVEQLNEDCEFEGSLVREYRSAEFAHEQVLVLNAALEHLSDEQLRAIDIRYHKGILEDAEALSLIHI